MFFTGKKTEMPSKADALPGRDTPMLVASKHMILGTPMSPPFPDQMEQVLFGMGCFWGAERKMWSLPGVYTTAVGYAAGSTPNPTYEEVCTGMTGHNEVVLVVYDPGKTGLDELLVTFWESHDPTQGMRQGNDRGTQYRSGIYCNHENQMSIAEESLDRYQVKLESAGRGKITTEILAMPTFFYAEDYHQQYLAKNPNGYCGLGGTGVCYR